MFIIDLRGIPSSVIVSMLPTAEKDLLSINKETKDLHSFFFQGHPVFYPIIAEMNSYAVKNKSKINNKNKAITFLPKKRLLLEICNYRYY